MSVGSPDQPLLVAVVGAGPAGFYVVEHLQRHEELAVAVDVYERLPTPYGLVRGGVAPDHQKIKSVTKTYERIAAHPAFRFLGGVEIGRHLALEDLNRHYHATILTVGAPNDRRMGIPGEDLRGSVSATDFVGWYNAHPDFVGLELDLDTEHAVVVGNGNVAVDVTRILASRPEDLATTDIADEALERLRSSRVTTITMLGRRGPAQAAFTPKEIRELGELSGATLVVDPADLERDPLSSVPADDGARRVMDALRLFAGRTPAPGDRVIRLRFLTSPTALRGDERVEAVDIVENELVPDGDSLRASPTGRTGTLPAGLVLRAVGYHGARIPGAPFDERAGVVPNAAGRAHDGRDGAPVPGLYVSGWIKRGPQGVIGTNKADAGETVTTLLRDLAAGDVRHPPAPDLDAAEASVRASGANVVTWSDWVAIDAVERAAGAAEGRPRRKLATVEDMLEVLERSRSSGAARG